MMEAEQKEKVLKRVFTHEEEKEIVEVSFQLPENVDELSIEMKVGTIHEEHATIDLGLRDPQEIRGWSGGSKSIIEIGIDTATPGYRPGKLNSGEWAVLLGAYKIPDTGCEVTLKVSYILKSPRWVRGDLHGHSVHSDGKYTLENVYEIVKNNGLDFMGLADHNTVTQNFSYPSQSEIVFIPGMELTTYHGHCNLLGERIPVEDFRVSDKKTLKRYFEKAREKGVKITINHPNDKNCEGCSWEWGWDIDFDWLEVWNGPWRDINQHTLERWQSNLTLGKRQVVVGGSDTHEPHPYIKHGYPTNWVCTVSRSVKGILDAIDRGHLFIGYAPESPFIELKCGSKMMGDVVNEKSNKDVHVNLYRLQKGDVIKVISNQGEVISRSTNEENHHFTLKRENHLFYRVEVWRYFDEAEEYLMAALSNPLYFESDR